VGDRLSELRALLRLIAAEARHAHDGDEDTIRKALARIAELVA
jgi:hypothetical protein